MFVKHFLVLEIISVFILKEKSLWKLDFSFLLEIPVFHILIFSENSQDFVL